MLEPLGGIELAEEPALQEQPVGLGVGPAAARRRRDVGTRLAARLRVGVPSQQRDAQLLHHGLRDVILYREDVVERSVVGLRPQVVAVGNLHELHRDANAIAGLAHASLQHGRDVERMSHLGHGRRTPVRERQHGDRGGRIERLIPARPCLSALEHAAGAPQLVRQRARALDAVTRVLLETQAHHALEVTRKVGAHARQGRGRVVDDRVAEVDVRDALERPAPGRELVDDDPEREQIAPRVHGLTDQLLRRHVGQRADQLPGRRNRLGDGGRVRQVVAWARRRELREPEVEHLEPALARHHDVAGLQVAVDNALVVRGRERVGERDREVQQPGERQSARRHERGERLALDQLHGEEADAAGFLDRVERHDVPVVQRGDGPRLALEALEQVGPRGQVRGQQLHRHVAAETGVAGAIDLAHAGAKRGDDLVRAQAIR